jgi:hypothetical protein
VAGLIFSFGNYEGTADFVVNALPNQQQRRIYHGKVVICKKEVLLGIFSSCLVDYAEDRSSDASMLAYDSAPGGIYDINAFGGNITGQIGTAFPLPLYRITVQPTFCFVPTTSALDIGGGNTALGPQNLTASYSGAAPPVAPFSTPFANFITASRENQTHILWNGLNSKWAFQEMQGAPQVFNCQAFCQIQPIINESVPLCTSTNYSIAGLSPDINVTWVASPTGILDNSTFTGQVFPASVSGGRYGQVKLQATISSACGTFVIERIIFVGRPYGPTLTYTDDPNGGCTNGLTHFRIENYSPALTYTITNRVNAGGGTPRQDFWVKGTPGSTGSFTLAVGNSCGSTSGSYTVSYPICRPAASPTAVVYTMSPNPAAQEVLVQQLPDNALTERATAAPDAGISLVRCYDSYGRLRLEQASKGTSTLRLNTEQLPAGLYIVHILRDQHILSRQQLRIEK